MVSFAAMVGDDTQFGGGQPSRPTTSISAMEPLTQKRPTCSLESEHEKKFKPNDLDNDAQNSMQTMMLLQNLRGLAQPSEGVNATPVDAAKVLLSPVKPELGAFPGPSALENQAPVTPSPPAVGMVGGGDWAAANPIGQLAQQDWGSGAVKLEPQPPSPPKCFELLGVDGAGRIGSVGGGSEDITAQIVGALKRLVPGEGRTPPMTEAPASFAPPQTPVPLLRPSAEPELGSRLLDSLRTLLPTGELAQVCGGSQDGQDIFRVVQEMTLPPPPALHLQAPEPVTQPMLAFPATTSSSSHDVEGMMGKDGDPIRLPPPHLGSLTVLRPPLPVEIDDDIPDGGEGVPHRLPPGFGAIPEDLIEERARQREDERIRRLKAGQPCRFSRACKRRDCPNAHPEGRDIDTVLNVCAFGRRCKRKNCFYDHPEGREMDMDPTKGMCKWGERCRRPDCLYDHPPGREPISGPELRICYFCHGPGHVAGECVRNPDSWAYNPEAAERERRLVAVTQSVATDTATVPEVTASA